MVTERAETDLLLPLEQSSLRRGYREFFKAKRNHFLSTIRYFNELWDAFQALDEIWVREIQNINRPGTSTQVLPAQLLINAHGKYRISGELAFSGCFADAWAVMRAGIEFTAHANRIYAEPELAKIWLHKDDGKAEAKAFEKAFLEKKKERLFHGLDNLYECWQLYSEWGSHSTAAILALRTKFKESPEGIHVEVSYLEGDESRVGPSVHWLLDVGLQMENILFNIFKERFQLDAPLLEMRRRFEQRHSDLREAILKRYGRSVNSNEASLSRG